MSASSTPAPRATGAKAGIAIGAVGGIALLCLGAWLLFRQYKAKKSSAEQSNELPAQVPVELPTEKGDVELEAKHGTNEAAGQGRASGFVEVFEMSGHDHNGPVAGEDGHPPG